MRVTLCDVGPRDGLQNEPETLDRRRGGRRRRERRPRRLEELLGRELPGRVCRAY